MNGEDANLVVEEDAFATFLTDEAGVDALLIGHRVSCS